MHTVKDKVYIVHHEMVSNW